MDCLFCNIITGKIPAKIIHDDQHVVAFNDIAPKAPVHTLIVPKQHISTINDLEETHKELVGHMVYTAQKLAQAAGIDQPGFRLVFNCNKEGGQTVHHIHLHLLGGRPMEWPPG